MAVSEENSQPPEIETGENPEQASKPMPSPAPPQGDGDAFAGDPAEEVKEAQTDEGAEEGTRLTSKSKWFSKARILMALAGLVIVLAAGFFLFKETANEPETPLAPLPDPQMIQANIMIQLKDYKSAQSIVHEVLVKSPENTNALSLSALIYLHQERISDAYTAARKTLEIDPDLAMPHAILGRVYLLESEWDLALEESRLAIINNPQLSLPYHVIGEIYLRKGRVEDSTEVLKEALKYDPENIEIMKKLGGAYVRAKQYGKAKLVLNRALKINSESAGVHFNLARMYSAINMGDLAIQHMDSAERLYDKAGSKIWRAKARNNKMTIAAKFGLSPESLQ